MAATRKPRLGPVVAAGVGALASAAARAETSVDFRFLYYGENDGRTQVLDPVLNLAHDFGRAGRVGLLLGYDSISGASPTGEYPTLDTTTSASGTTVASGDIPKVEYRDTRRAASVSYSRRFGSHLPSVELSYSREQDYISRGGSVGEAWNLFGGRSTLHLGYGITRDRVEPVTLADRFDKQGDSYSLGWTQILGPRDLVDVSASQTRLSGYLTDPYKVVSVGSTTLPEVRPDSRTRHAYVFKYGHAFVSRGALKVSYRYYDDSWSIRAHTVELVHDQRFDRGWIVTPRLRYYSQGSASFFAYEFAEPMAYMSADYRLSSFSSWLGGLGVTHEIGPNLSVNVAATYQSQRGRDRVLARPAALTPQPLLRGEPGEGGDDGEGGGGTVAPAEVSPADLKTVTVTVGFSYRF